MKLCDLTSYMFSMWMLERLGSNRPKHSTAFNPEYVSIQAAHIRVSKQPMGLPTLLAPYTTKFGMGEEKKSLRSIKPPIVLII